MKAKHKVFVWILVFFLLLYGAFAWVMTFMTQRSFQDRIRADFEESNQNFARNVVTLLTSEARGEINTEDTDMQLKLMAHSSTLYVSQPEYMIYSVAIEDEDHEMIAKTGEVLALNDPYSSYWPYAREYLPANDYLTETQLQKLAYFGLENNRYAGNSVNIRPYRYKAFVDPESEALAKLAVQHLTWLPWDQVSDVVGEKVTWTEDGKETEAYYLAGTEDVWGWENPEFAEIPDYRLKPMSVYVILPNLGNKSENTKGWQKWRESEWIQNFLAEFETLSTGNLDGVEGGVMHLVDHYYTSSQDDPDHNVRVMLLCEAYPWQAAVSYLKIAYIEGFYMLLICLALSWWGLGRIFKKQAELEQMQREFTNAVAHEMKTPLAIIRGFSENMAEGVKPEKQAYYLTQIIDQTRKMDDMVAEMIDMAKIDSEKLVLQQDEIRMSELLAKLIGELTPSASMRQITFKENYQSELIYAGDARYLKKALFNLLDNAVCYADPGTEVCVYVDQSGIRIENICPPIPEEKLAHLFEMLYRGNESRTKDDRQHLGIGLYLTKKILTRHSLHVKIENISGGVRVTVYK